MIIGNINEICSLKKFYQDTICKTPGYAALSQKISAQPFICEVSHPDIRGLTASLRLFYYTAGFSLAILLGSSLPWRYMIGAQITVAVLGFIGLLFIHESPIRLLGKGI